MVEIKVVTEEKQKDTQEEFKPRCLEDKRGKLYLQKHHRTRAKNPSSWKCRKAGRMQKNDTHENCGMWSGRWENSLWSPGHKRYMSNQSGHVTHVALPHDT